jgi:hypothetical protein
MRFPSRAHLKIAAGYITDITYIVVDCVELFNETLQATLKLRQKSRSICIGDMVVIRMGSGHRRLDIGKTGLVVHKGANPVWTKYCILINGERHDFAIDEIERSDRR